jgi:exopolysaccharide biosynthesis polyprenyl glycosylphosphotransferase
VAREGGVSLSAELTVERKIRRLPAWLSLATQRRLLRVGLLGLDATMLLAAFGTAYGIRFLTDWSFFRPDAAESPAFYGSLVVALLPLWLLVFLVVGLYNEHNLLGGTREYALVFNGVSAGMLLVVFASFLYPGFVVARAWLLLSWLLAFVFVAVARFWVRRLVYVLRTRGYFLSPALIVGVSDEALALAEQLVSWRTSGLHVLGFVTPGPSVGQRVFRNLYVVGGLGDLEGMIDRFRVEEIVIATSALSRAELVDLFRRFASRSNVQLRLSSGLFEVVTTGIEVKELAYVPLVNVHPVRLTGVDVVLKTLLDYSIAIAVCVLLSPLYLALALAVRLDSPGPILHRRRVLGLGGREFDALKFRTMYNDGEAILARHTALQDELSRSHKLRHDPRVTRVGRLLRRFSLDELPQLFNVLLGQMSVVGPRMISPAEHSEYHQWDMNLLTVRPGITGLWQVSGRSEVSYQERVQLDMSYIRNWTIWLDLQILLQTLPAVLRGRGAY